MNTPPDFDRAPTEPPPSCPATDPVLPDDGDDAAGDECAACLNTGMRIVTAGSYFAPVETKPCFCGVRP